MRYVQVNAYSGGWADSIIFKRHRELVANGDESWVFWARGEHEQDEHMQRIASYPEVCLDALLTRLDGKPGFHSRFVTRRLLRRLDEIDPDVVHLHLLLGYYINVKMLFEWLAAHRCRVVWTLHDCWAFTGHCIHFTYAKCEQWKTGCAAYGPCPQKRTYPETLAGDSAVRWSFERKRELFTMLPAERVQLITPSQWLADLVGQSFLGKYNVRVVHNTVNTDVFRPTPSDFRKRCGIGDRFMVLGVASKWSVRKGLDDFVRLARELDSDRFAVVVVGLSDKQIKWVSGELTALPKTGGSRSLAKAYTAADALVNPSAEEAFGINVVDAAACDTRAVVVEGLAYAEVAKDTAMVSADLSTLMPTIVNMQGEGCAILMPKTDNPMQLAAIYTAADIFFNPTQEDNYPTVNLEAEACGTPVVSYDTGGCRETMILEESIIVHNYEEALFKIKTKSIL